MSSEDSGLSGVYSFVPTPWDENYRLDEATLRADISYLCSTPVHGIYTPDSAGEFYELSFDEFSSVVDAMVETAAGTDTNIQIGCHWTNAEGALKRAECATKHDIEAVRFSFPYWEDPNFSECLGFIEDLAAVCGSTPLVHYNTANNEITLGPEEYTTITERIPQFIGTKIDTLDPIYMTELIDQTDELSHFVPEYTFTQGMAAGASGMYSWLAATNPRLAREWYDACESGRWARAIEIQSKINEWSVQRMSTWNFSSTAARTKLDAKVNPNFECPLRVKPPYESGSEDEVRWAREWASEHFPELLNR